MNAEDSVHVDLKGDFDLGNAPRSWWDAIELEVSKQMVVFGHGPLTLVHLDVDRLLVVGVGGEHLRLLGWHSGLALHDASHDSTNGFDANGQRQHIHHEELIDSRV
mmetsp:Transcript_6461/g.7545  ORF Transcript_6461/g.7545 Transcript_6461/m.7545 type:complete len:106 (-) Transcript_6461:377-694(-)